MNRPLWLIVAMLFALGTVAVSQPIYHGNTRVNWPALGGALISAGPGNNNPTAIAETDGNCLKGVSGAWASAACAAAGSVTTTGTPASGNLAKFSGPATITNGDLSGDVTTSATLATTIKSSVALAGNPTTTTQASGDNSTKIATTAFVASALSGVNPAVAVQAATTAAGDTSAWTYANGVSGVGATFTGPVNGVVTIDGFTFNAVGQRLLVKNDTQSPSGAFNGVYSLTALHTVGTGDIYTRALDYNQPGEINNTGAIPIINGTVNGSTTWVITSAVTTIGTDPLTYAQFSYAPSSIAQLGVAQTFTKSQRSTVQSLVISTATFTPNFDNGNNFTMTLVHASCPCTLANPSTSPVAGQAGVIEIIQSATGSDTIGTWGSDYTFAGGTSTITLSTGASARDYFSYYVADSTHIVLSAGALNATH